MPSHADSGSFRPKSKWMNRTSYWRVCQQIRRTYGKGGSSKEPALWKSGICVTDGYQVYHTLEKEREDLTIAGCWVHARRRFDGALTLVPKEGQKESASCLILKQIQDNAYPAQRSVTVWIRSFRPEDLPENRPQPPSGREPSTPQFHPDRNSRRSMGQVPRSS